MMGEIILETAKATEDRDGIGCAKLVVFCNAPDDNPFMAGAFHGVTERMRSSMSVSCGPGVMRKALESVHGADFGTLAKKSKDRI